VSKLKVANVLKIANVIISDSWGEISLDSFNKGIGGREGAMVFLSHEWAKQGHEVVNFINTEKGTRNELESGGSLSFLPLETIGPILQNFPYDAVIAWECPSVFKNDLMTNLRICEMQVCHFVPGERDLAEKYSDYIAALSPWHKYFMMEDGLDMSEEKIVVFPNGVDINRYPKHIISKKKGISDNPKFVYSSSPDRGLWTLLSAWPYIKKSFPGAELNIAYGVKKWTNALRWSHNRQGEIALQIEQMMKQDGVKDLGKIGQQQLAELQLEADAWLYPLDSIAPTESGCITAVENAAAGNPIITTDCDCMETEFGPVGVIAELPFEPEGYAECVEYVLSDYDIVEKLRKDGREFAEGRDWSIIAKQWTDFIEEHKQ
jgi:glycosyltransferase involved in cell wall biosynthesis